MFIGASFSLLQKNLLQSLWPNGSSSKSKLYFGLNVHLTLSNRNFTTCDTTISITVWQSFGALFTRNGLSKTNGPPFITVLMCDTHQKLPCDGMCDGIKEWYVNGVLLGQCSGSRHYNWTILDYSRFCVGVVHTRNCHSILKTRPQYMAD